MVTTPYPGVAYPGSAYPGYAGTGFIFTPPIIQRPLTVDRPEFRPFNRVKGNVGLTVLKNGESYSTVEHPTAEQVDAADIAYLGGRSYYVTEDEASALTAAGYEVTEE